MQISSFKFASVTWRGMHESKSQANYKKPHSVGDQNDIRDLGLCCFLWEEFNNKAQTKDLHLREQILLEMYQAKQSLSLFPCKVIFPANCSKCYFLKSTASNPNLEWRGGHYVIKKLEVRTLPFGGTVVMVGKALWASRHRISQMEDSHNS